MINFTHEEKWFILKNRVDYPNLARLIEKQNEYRFRRDRYEQMPM